MMKRIAGILLGVLASVASVVRGADGNMIGQMTQNEGFFAVPAPKAVVVDGALGEWDLSGEIWSYPDHEVREQYSVKSAAMWDRENLYLSFVWKDPTPLNGSVNPDLEPSIGWRADAVQCRMKVGGQILWLTSWWYEGRSCLQVDHWERSDKPGKPVPGKMDVRVYQSKPGEGVLGEGMESVYKKLAGGDGFVHELKVPWKVLAHGVEFVPRAGEKILCGLEFKWADLSGKGWPALQFTDNMSEGNTSRQFYWENVGAWGEIELVGGSVKAKREYVYAVEKPEGTIPVRAEVPEDAAIFTLVLEDAKGVRVRNLANGFAVENYRVGAPRKGWQVVEVLWDGLDDFGKLCEAGEYRVRGLTHRGLSSEYVMSFYNPGTPPWATPDGKGAWGADHSPVRFVARSGDRMLLATGFVEGGYGLWALDAEGKKLWSDVRGLVRMSANEKYAFTVPNHWHTKDTLLYRYNAETGEQVPFVKDGKARAADFPVREVLGVEALEPVEEGSQDFVLGLAAGPESVLMALAKGEVAEIDAETGDLRATFKLDYDWVRGEGRPHFVPMAYDGKVITYFKAGALVQFEVATKAERTVALEGGMGCAVAVALGGDGTLYVADMGEDCQVKRFSAEGTLLGTFGKKGGRPREGMYEPEGMREVSSVAVDASNNVWVAELQEFPRRVSVWKPDGKLLREYVGNTHYSGGGAYLHDSEVGRAFVGSNELVLDEVNHTWKMKRVLINKEPGKGVSQEVGFGVGQIFYSEASGEKREYMFQADTMNFRVYLNDRGTWKVVSAVMWLGMVQGLKENVPGGGWRMKEAPSGEWEGFNPFNIVVWNDVDGDGEVQRKECEIIPSQGDWEGPGKPLPRGGPLWNTGWGQRMDPEDLSFYVSVGEERGTRYRLKPKRFAKNGAPIYSYSTCEKVVEALGSMDTVPVPGEDMVVTFSDVERKGVIMGFTKSAGDVKWTYPSPYTAVHGSHRAVMPKPGLLIGPLKVAGVVKDCGEASGVFMMRGNLGSDFYLTTDGLYVDSMFRDTRLPAATLPADEEALRGMPFNLFSMGSEPFNGWIGRQDDGEVRMLCGFAGQAASLVKIHGLETIRRFQGGVVKLDERMRVKADAANVARASQAAEAKTYTIERVEKVPANWPEWTKIPSMGANLFGQQEFVQVRLAYNEEALFAHFFMKDPTSLWKNGGTDKTRLFKTGDCVDLCLSPSGNKGREAVEGDLRVLTAPFGEGAVTMLMRKHWKAAKKEEQVRYQSPVFAFEMAQVKELGTPAVELNERAQTVMVTVTVPWSELGVKPQSGMVMRGDVGMILSDPTGRFNTARVYYSNKQTNLISDLPSEANLYPHLWTEFVLK